MRPSNISAPSTVEFWAEIVASRQPISCGRVELSLSEFQGEYRVVQSGQVARLRPKDISDQHLLDQLLAGGSARLAYVNMLDSAGKVNITAHFFYGALQEFGDIEIGIDEHIFRPAIRLGLRYKDANDLAKKLLDRFVIAAAGGDQNFYFMLEAGREANDDLASDEQNLSDGSNGSGADIQCFSLIGDGIRVPVRKRKLLDGKEILFAHRLSSDPARRSATTTRLAYGHLRFTDYTSTGAMKALAAGAMNRLVQSKDSYLSKWDAYGDIEGGFLLARMRLVGGLNFLDVEQTPEGTRLILKEELSDEVVAELGEGSEIEILDEIPTFISDASVTWADFIELLEKESQERHQMSRFRFDGPPQFEPDESEPDASPASGQSESYFKVVRTDRRSVTVDKQVLPDLVGKWIVLSVKGDMVQIERRMEARRLIQAGKSANPLLGMIIEENSEYPAPFRRASLQALNYFVKNKVFKKGKPTLTQEKAIGIALNTPDIVVIQGPPGTGKTTVISAIIERLNQEHDKTKSVKGEILVSGFQHDAVENIISRLSVNALPPVKFGHRSGQDADLVAERIGLWCQELATRVREKNPLVKQSEQRRRLGQLSRTYIVSPSRQHAVSLLQQIAILPVNLLGSDLLARTHDLIETLEEEAIEDEAKNLEKLHTVRALRVTHQGFVDDGPDTAQAVREFCGDELQDDENSVLRKAVLWESEQALSFLEALRLLKARLLRLYTPRPAFQIEKARNDVLEHVASVTRQLEISTRQSTSNLALPILADFLFELECNPNGVIEAVEDYNYVYAATCQQAQGSAIRRAKQRKTVGGRKEPIEYDTVIVDEAARVSPRDLLIPMAQGRRRIILVGDHRQLPHLVDDAIADQLQGSVGADESGFIRKSMFEHLIRRLRSLEERDGICRTVTLDEQYRMHPLLGNFVNNQFYKPHGEFFTSPLPAEKFEHHLPDTENAPLAWMEVPASDGQAKKSKSGSWRRPCEATRIAAQLLRWIDSPEGTGLSFGIITFYRAQTFAIYEALEQYGLTKQGPDGEWGIDEEYRFLRKAKDGNESVERLRIGTVDAFQGMEFDVVFLSITRSLRASRGRSDRQEKTPDVASMFGRIMSENLQCVSMSRQKRLLVVAGDSELLKHPLAEKSIPALCALRALCEEKGAML